MTELEIKLKKCLELAIEGLESSDRHKMIVDICDILGTECKGDILPDVDYHYHKENEGC